MDNFETVLWDGVSVGEVYKNSPAYSAGLRRGNNGTLEIVSVNGVIVRTITELSRVFRANRNRKVSLGIKKTFMSGGKVLCYRKNFDVSLGHYVGMSDVGLGWLDHSGCTLFNLA